MSTPSKLTEKNIVIIGGSYGGLSTAHYILKHVVKDRPYNVILVSPSTKVMCRPACPRALISDDMFPQDRLFVSVEKGFEAYREGSFQFVNAKATSLDYVNRQITVTSNSGTEDISYHALIIATGASTPSPLLGLNRDSDFLRESWATFRKSLPDAKSIVIAGGGPAGVETAGELGEYLNGRNSSTPKVAITLISASSDILPILRPSIAKKAEMYLANVGVTVLKGVRVVNVEPSNSGIEDVASKSKITLDNGNTLDADLYIPATGTKPNTEFIPKELLTSDGRVDTNSSTLRVEKAGERVYAIGDVSSAARPAIHLILNAVPVLCSNIKRDLLIASGEDVDSVGGDRIYEEDKRETQMVPIGKSKGVGAFMGWAMPSIVVWMLKGRDYWLWTTGNLWSGKQWAKES